MGLDIRLPMGLLFTTLGVMLAGYGLVADPAIYERSLGLNVNLWWGLCVLALGLVFLGLARRGRSAMRPAETTPEGRATEAREHDLGLERPDA
jgi:hypothetical protein